MLTKGPPTSHNSLKIAIQETSVKAFSTSTYIINQSRFELGRALMPKRMVSQPLRIKTSKLVGGSVLLKRPLKVSNNGMTNKSKKCLTYNNRTKGCKQDIMSQRDYHKKGLHVLFPPKNSFIWMNFGTILFTTCYNKC